MNSNTGISFEEQGFKEAKCPVTTTGISIDNKPFPNISAQNMAIYMNASATIGYSSMRQTSILSDKRVPVITDGRRLWAYSDVQTSQHLAFVSRTSSGKVVTLTGTELRGRLPIPFDGRIWGMARDIDPAACYAGHIEALRGETPVTDAEWLRNALEGLPSDLLFILFRNAVSKLVKE